MLRAPRAKARTGNAIEMISLISMGYTSFCYVFPRYARVQGYRDKPTAQSKGLNSTATTVKSGITSMEATAVMGFMGFLLSRGDGVMRG